MFDYLIIGQGLSGSLLAFRLLQQGFKVLVIDDPDKPMASRVAAGIFNPITGRNLTLTWLAQDLFPYLSQFYQELENYFNISFVHHLPIYRLFKDIKQQNLWMGKAAGPSFSKFVAHHNFVSKYGHQINDDFGGFEINSGGYINIPVLLDRINEYLRDQNAFLPDWFNEKALVLHSESITYREISARYVIYCEGPFDAESKYFSWLPFRRVSGEMITIRTEKLPEVIINRGIFILPFGDGIYKVGATYNWKKLSWEPTNEGLNYLEEKLKTLLKADYKIEDKFAGVRPATLDRRPFIGRHPKHRRLFIFNGFGTKGVSLIPYLSLKFCEFLLDNKELPEEININRYFSLY